MFVGLLILPCLLHAQPLTSEENEELQRICGQLPKQSRNVLGAFKSMNTKNTTRFQVPWAAQWQRTSTIGTSLCSGTIISKRHILTAAHCISLECDNEENDFLTIDAQIFLSTFCNKELCDAQPSQVFQVKKAYAHRSFFNSNCGIVKSLYWNDVGILELEKDIEFSNVAQPICLGDFLPKIGENVTIYGYGQVGEEGGAGILRKFSAPVRSKLECAQVDQEIIRNDVHCTSNGKQQTCRGDSGGGETTMRLNKHFVVGVNSYVKEHCGQNKRPGPPTSFSTNLLKHYGWICAVTGVCSGWKPTGEVKKALEAEYYTFEIENSEK